MSCREVEGERPLETGDGNGGNVVQLQTAAGRTLRGAARAREAQRTAARDAITRDGLDLLKAFFAIGDAPARAAVLMMAQRLARQPGKR